MTIQDDSVKTSTILAETITKATPRDIVTGSVERLLVAKIKVNAAVFHECYGKSLTSIAKHQNLLSFLLENPGAKGQDNQALRQ